MPRPLKEVIADLDLARATERISSEEHARVVAEVRASAVGGLVDFDSSSLDGRVGGQAVSGGHEPEIMLQRSLQQLVPGDLVSTLLKGAAGLVGALGALYLIMLVAEVADGAVYDRSESYAAIASVAFMIVSFMLSCLGAAAIIDVLRFNAIQQALGQRGR